MIKAQLISRQSLKATEYQTNQKFSLFKGSQINLKRSLIQIDKRQKNFHTNNQSCQAAIQQSNASRIKFLWRRVSKPISNFNLALAEMAVISALSFIGIFIEQGQKTEKYASLFPDDAKHLFNYKTLLFLQLDHVYSSYYYVGMMMLLGASLLACSSTTQWPQVKIAKRWKYRNEPAQLRRIGNYQILPSARLDDLARVLALEGFQIFLERKPMVNVNTQNFLKPGQQQYGFKFDNLALNPSQTSSQTQQPNNLKQKEESVKPQIRQQLYAFKGLIGKYSPIGVHISMILVILGFLWSGCGQYDGAVIIPKGQDFYLQDYLHPATVLARPNKEGFDQYITVNNFDIKYRPDGKVDQFYSYLTSYDKDNMVTKADQVSVNHPFRNKGVTMYQTDWAIAAIGLRVQDKSLVQKDQNIGDKIQIENHGSSQSIQEKLGKKDIINTDDQDVQDLSQSEVVEIDDKSYKPLTLPMADLGGVEGKTGRIWGTFVQTQQQLPEEARPQGASIVMKDLQTVVFYDNNGQFVGVRRPGSGSPIEVAGTKIIVDDIVPSTGLELKYDPGIPLVFTGFGGLIITTFLSYSKHQQIWAYQDGDEIHVGGRSNKAPQEFKDEYLSRLDQVPDNQIN